MAGTSRASLASPGRRGDGHAACPGGARPAGPGDAAALRQPAARAAGNRYGGNPEVTLQLRQAQQWLGLVDEAGNPLSTVIWGYGLPDGPTTTPGPTLMAASGQPMQVLWENALPVAGHLLPVDTSIHMAMPQDTTLAEGYVPTVVHLHGAHAPSASDGLPEAWFTQDFAETGPVSRLKSIATPTTSRRRRSGTMTTRWA
ncbi:hypothetical protein [Dankookia sp. P2]|uniref:hypothetical protein n=1 Tax=Dankookia sp. P2 TaxID=3423955 RepID=UPI003D66CB16